MKDEDFSSAGTHSTIERLCDLARARIIQISETGGPFAMIVYWRGGPKKYGYRVPVETDRGPLAAFFISRYGLLQRPAAFLLRQLGRGPLARVSLSGKQYLDMVPEAMRQGPENVSEYMRNRL